MKVRLQGKITGLVLAAVLVVFTLIFTVTTVMNRTENMNQANQIAMSKSAELANDIASTLNGAMDVARSFAHTIESMAEKGPLDRDAVNGILSGTLRRNPHFLGTWTCWEPNAFDGKDGEFANTAAHDETGRFVPYWFHSGQKIETEALRDYDKPGDGDYYLLALKSGRESILEPFDYEMAGGKMTLMTSFAVPVKINGSVCGVAGVDMALEDIIETVRKVRLYDTGFGRLLSNTGIVAGHPDEKRVGEVAGEITEPGGDRVLKAIQAGDSWVEEAWSEALKRNTMKSYAPVRIGNTTTPWSFGTVILGEEIMASSDRLLRVTIIMAAASLLLISLVVWLIARSIARPVKRVAELAHRAQAGDLTISREDFAIRSRDELGEMADSLTAMIKGQADTVIEIQKAAKAVAAGAENLAALSEETNASMEEVRSHLTEAASLSETNAAAIEEGTAGVEEVAGGAQAMAKSAAEGASEGENAGETAGMAVEKVNGVIRSIGEVGEKAKTSVGSMSLLAEAVKDISSFVEVITSIADQTNLLALNAAIEAARAGDAGRGFAVVADEVRKLAEESARAASKVSSLIGDLEKNTNDSLSITLEAGQIMERTIAEAKEAGGELQESLQQIKGILDAVRGMAAASEEQAASSEEMASAMDQLSKGTIQITELVKNISDASEETSRAAEGVANLAQEMSARGDALVETVSHFKVESGPSGLVPLK